MYQLEIEIPIAPTDSNKILGVNKYAKHAVFSKVKVQMLSAIIGKAPEKPLANFKLSVTRYSSKTLDYDNFIASLKPFIDSLKLAGVIVDDNWNFIKHIHVNQVISTERKLVMRVEEVPEIVGRDNVREDAHVGEF